MIREGRTRLDDGRVRFQTVCHVPSFAGTAVWQSVKNDAPSGDVTGKPADYSPRGLARAFVALTMPARELDVADDAPEASSGRVDTVAFRTVREVKPARRLQRGYRLTADGETVERMRMIPRTDENGDPAAPLVMWIPCGAVDVADGRPFYWHPATGVKVALDGDSRYRGAPFEHGTTQRMEAPCDPQRSAESARKVARNALETAEKAVADYADALVAALWLAAYNERPHVAHFERFVFQTYYTGTAGAGGCHVRRVDERLHEHCAAELRALEAHAAALRARCEAPAAPYVAPAAPTRRPMPRATADALPRERTVREVVSAPRVVERFIGPAAPHSSAPVSPGAARAVLEGFEGVKGCSVCGRAACRAVIDPRRPCPYVKRGKGFVALERAAQPVATVPREAPRYKVAR